MRSGKNNKRIVFLRTKNIEKKKLFVHTRVYIFYTVNILLFKHTNVAYTRTRCNVRVAGHLTNSRIH